MADPKYTNLPGIAYDQPDCYETSDLPESDQYTDYNEPDEENISIEKVHLNPEAASEIFRGKYLDGSKVDFSDRITKPRRQRGYDAQTLWELAPAGEPETTLQKYLRLKCEFQELINDIQTKGIGTDDPNLNSEEIIKETMGMQKQLLELRLEKNSGGNGGTGAPAQLKNKIAAKLEEINPNENKGKKSTSESGTGIQYELCIQSAGSIANSQINRVTELEQRLQRIETVMGCDRKDKLTSISLNSKNQSILGCLNVLNTKLSLLEPSHLELLEARLSSVLQKVTKISEKKLDVQELERTLKLSDLYDLMEESLGTIQALPDLTSRLSSLKELHQNAAEIVKELADVKSLQEAIANGTIENDRLLKDLQGVLNETLKHVK